MAGGLLAAPAMAQAAEWALLSAQDEVAVFLDKASVTRGPATAWVLFVQHEAYYVSRFEYDCSGRRYRMLNLMAYDTGSSTAKTSSSEVADWSAVTPNSLGEDQLKAVCEGKVPHPDETYTLSARNVSDAVASKLSPSK